MCGKVGEEVKKLGVVGPEVDVGDGHAVGLGVEMGQVHCASVLECHGVLLFGIGFVGWVERACVGQLCRVILESERFVVRRTRVLVRNSRQWSDLDIRDRLSNIPFGQENGETE